MHDASLWIEPGGHPPDGAVLAGGIDALQDDEQRPRMFRIEPLLQIRHPLALRVREFLGVLLGEPCRLARVMLGQPEAIGTVDAEPLDQRAGLHDATLEAPARPSPASWSSSHYQGLTTLRLSTWGDTGAGQAARDPALRPLTPRTGGAGILRPRPTDRGAGSRDRMRHAPRDASNPSPRAVRRAVPRNAPCAVPEGSD